MIHIIGTALLTGGGIATATLSDEALHPADPDRWPTGQVIAYNRDAYELWRVSVPIVTEGKVMLACTVPRAGVVSRIVILGRMGGIVGTVNFNDVLMNIGMSLLLDWPR